MKEEKKLSIREKEIQIFVKIGEFEEDLKGSVDQVLRALMAFLDKIYPGLEVLTKVRLTVDLQEVIELMKNVVAIAQGGPVILYKRKLSSKELIGLNLIGAFVGYKLNLLDRDSLTLDDLVNSTKKTKGSVSGTLTNMSKELLVEKPERGRYRISILGIKHFVEIVFPKIKKKTQENTLGALAGAAGR